MDCFSAYNELIEFLRNEARKHGYALATHGSLARDIDLIAVPWIEECDTPERLVNGLSSIVRTKYNSIRVLKCPKTLAHGREAWAIFFGDGLYIDLSVMPGR